MDAFQKKFLQTLAAEYAKLSEREKMTGGVETRVLARLLASDLDIEVAFVDDPEYHSSEPHLKILNTGKHLAKAGLVNSDRIIGGVGWVSPTTYGSSLVEQWEEERSSPVFQGQRLLRWLYEVQQEFDELDRSTGRAGQVDVDQYCALAGTSRTIYVRAANWGKRQGYLGEVVTNYRIIDNGGIFISDEGMIAVEKDFQGGEQQPSQVVNINNSTFQGNVVAAGRNAMVISTSSLAPHTDEIRSILGEVQRVIETLSEDDDDRFDALQQLTRLQRELAKPAPSVERAERGINLIGSITSISAAVAPHLAQLLDFIQRIPR